MRRPFFYPEIAHMESQIPRKLSAEVIFMQDYPNFFSFGFGADP